MILTYLITLLTFYSYRTSIMEGIIFDFLHYNLYGWDNIWPDSVNDSNSYVVCSWWGSFFNSQQTWVIIKDKVPVIRVKPRNKLWEVQKLSSNYHVWWFFWSTLFWESYQRKQVCSLMKGQSRAELFCIAFCWLLMTLHQYIKKVSSCFYAILTEWEYSGYCSHNFGNSANSYFRYIHWEWHLCQNLQMAHVHLNPGHNPDTLVWIHPIQIRS